MKIKDFIPSAKLNGRTIYDEEKETLFMNWSCSGFSFGLEGKKIAVKVKVMSNKIPGMPGMPDPAPDWPCIALAIDNGMELFARQELREDKWVTLWESAEVERHEFRILKPSENARGKLGIEEIEVDGEVFRLEPKKKRMEIIGDSITCGFGNEAPNNSFEFKTIEENAWSGYAAQAARALDYDFSMICESGINAIRPKHQLWDMHAMEDIYEFTDELYESQIGKELTRWDFEANHNDIVVMNLGTNDSNPIKFYRDFRDIESHEKWFHKQFKKFVRHLRELNGKDTYILCSLGSMDYYLYHHIKEVVDEIREEDGDDRLFSFEYVAINPMFEGLGAAGHPSQKTHDRMAKELVNYINKFVGE